MTMPRPLAVLSHLWLMAAVAYSAAVPTQDTMVVSRYEGVTDTILTDQTQSTVSTAEVTTEEHTPPIKLTEMDVKSVITMRYAHTAVVAHVRNPAKRAQEANFRVLLPETAFISGFVMTIDGKSYKAYVKEKEEAKQIYQDAVSHGYGAAHIATKARDSNHFTVSVNVEPSSNAIFNLTYEELLVRRNDVYNCAINLHPGAVVPKFTVTVSIKESANISELRVPEIRTGNEIDATKNDAQMSNVIIQREGRTAVITFSPDLEEQRRLMDVYAEKSKESATGQSANEGVLGQFVVQYDVQRSKDGEILVNDGYFVHFFAPDLPPLNKNVVFVLDTSGSMMGTKIEQLKQAMQTILSELNPGDYFSIVDFDSTVTIHSLSEVDKEPPKRHYYYHEVQQDLKLEEPSQATPENIEKARVIISRLEAYGGTNINSALSIAVDLINKYGKHSETNVGSTSSTTVPTASANETTIIDKKTVVNKKDEIQKLEPIIIFLTDGDPTVGETNTRTIINHLTEKNYGENKAPIYALAFGEDADRKFLRKLALRNDGFARHIYEAADAALQLHDFYRQVSSPLLADVKFVYPPDQVNEDTTTKHKFRTFYAGSELVVAGHLIPTAKDLDIQVSGFCGVLDDGFTRKKYDKKIKVLVPAEKEDLPLERLWAYLTVKQMLDEIDSSDASESEKNEENSPHKKALNLALKYSFVTPLTSLVVVKPNETNAVNAESVDKQSNNAQFAFQALSIPAAPSFAAYRPVSGQGGPMYSSAIRGSSYAYHSHHKFSPQSAGSIGYPSSAHGLSSFVSTPNRYALNSWSPMRHQASAQDLSLSQPQFAFGAASAFDSAMMYEYEDAAEDIVDIQRPQIVYNRLEISPALTTPFWGLAPTFQPVSTTETTTTPSGLETYHLKDFSWAESLLDASKDAIVLQANETVTLNLSRDSQAPKASAGDANCANAVEGGDGLCVYLTRCYEARNITADLYKTNYCIVDGGYAGVCCHQNKIDMSTDDALKQKLSS